MLFLPDGARADLNKNPIEGFSAGLKDEDNPLVWEIMIMGPPETPYDGGFFRSEMIFPADYPNLPPKLKFVSEFYHPNVYPDGTVCISILHPPGEDAFGYEAANERWLPIHTVESILVSVLSMISSPNIESPANIDAGVRAMRHAPHRHHHHHPRRHSLPCAISQHAPLAVSAKILLCAEALPRRPSRVQETGEQVRAPISGGVSGDADSWQYFGVCRARGCVARSRARARLQQVRAVSDALSLAVT